VALLLLSVAPVLSAREKEVHARWEELAPLVERRDVETVLTNGVHVRGRAERVLPDALEVRVKKTSDAAAIPKGRTRIPRELVSVLTARWKTHGGRALLTPTLPIAAGYSLALLHIGADEYGTKGGYGLLIGFATAGYLVGDRIDRKSMRVVLVPKRPAQGSSGGQGTCGRIEWEGGIQWVR